MKREGAVGTVGDQAPEDVVSLENKDAQQSESAPFQIDNTAMTIALKECDL